MWPNPREQTRLLRNPAAPLLAGFSQLGTLDDVNYVVDVDTLEGALWLRHK